MYSKLIHGGYKGIAAYYAFACFPKVGHPDLVNYVQAIPEIMVFTNFVNDALRYVDEGLKWMLLSCY